jgi:phosphoacetylglucosamine mutase
MNSNQILSYGTSGFRYNQQILMNNAEKIGISIAYLTIRRLMDRIKAHSCLHCDMTPSSIEITKTVKVVGTWGLMITASHNPSEDNGVKIVDSAGKMVNDDEERFLERSIRNSLTVSDVFADYGLGDCLHDQITFDSSRLRILIGLDTRESGRKISNLIVKGIESVLPDTMIYRVGQCTTPELHILTTKYVQPYREHAIYPTLSISEQFLQIADLDEYIDPFFLGADTYYVRYIRHQIKKYSIDLSTVTVDCANGVGYCTLRNIFRNSINAPQMINTNIRIPDKLNNKCGSDYVENNSKIHEVNLTDLDVVRRIWTNTVEGRMANRYHRALLHSRGYAMADRHKSYPNRLSIKDYLFCSFDGDADRIVFYYLDIDPIKKGMADITGLKIRLMNGDHISAMLLKFVTNTLLESSHLRHTSKDNASISIGVIHTPYSNGGFMQYVDETIANIRNQTDKITIHRRSVPIGVKNLIREAESYDIAIYFESNGHGSIIVKNHYNIPELKALKDLFNQVIGDGIMNMIGIHYILDRLDLSPSDFYSIFGNRRSIMEKIRVPSEIRNMFSMDGIYLIEPRELVSKFKEIENRYENSRIYVRPSGTEPILRAYIEGSAEQDLNKIKLEVVQHINEYTKRSQTADDTSEAIE